MIHELRRAHAFAARALLVVPPALLAAAVLGRPAVPRTGALPVPAPGGGPALDLAPEFPVRVTAAWDSATGRVRLGLVAAAPLPGPDPLVYWAPREPGADGGLPPGSRLIGPVGHSRAVEATVAHARLGRTGRLILVERPGRRVAATTPVRLPIAEKR